MSDLREALSNAMEESGRTAKLRQAAKLQEDIETLRDPPEQLKEDIAALVDCENYETAKAKLERL